MMQEMEKLKEEEVRNVMDLIKRARDMEKNQGDAGSENVTSAYIDETLSMTDAELEEYVSFEFFILRS